MKQFGKEQENQPARKLDEVLKEWRKDEKPKPISPETKAKLGSSFLVWHGKHAISGGLSPAEQGVRIL